MKLRVLIISLVLTIAMSLFAVSLATSTTQPTSVNGTSTTVTNTTGANTIGTNAATSNNGIDSYVTPSSGTGTTTLSASNDIVVESTSNINNNSKDFGFNEILNILLIAPEIPLNISLFPMFLRLTQPLNVW